MPPHTIEVPPRLCNPGQLHFVKSVLTTEEAFEQWAINTVLPRPYHPKLEIVENKRAMRCLTTVVHYQLCTKLLQNLEKAKPMLLTCLAWKEKHFTSASLAGPMMEERS